MNKINGYTEDEAKYFIRFVTNGRKEGKSLSRLFQDYANDTGRAKGSVRNYYYALLKQREDERVQQLLQGTNLMAGKVESFSEEETENLVKNILAEKAKGSSVRQAVIRLADGDDKKMLRYQNKYRNVLSKEPERIQRLSRGEAQMQVERSIDALYDRLCQEVKEENEKLRNRLLAIERENHFLRMQIKRLQA